MKVKGLNKEEQEILIPPSTILLGYMGSLSHGTWRPSTDPVSIDDKDIMGVCIGNQEDYFGFGRFQQKETKYKEWDSVIYEIRKMFRLLLNVNPNVLGLLWLRENFYIHIDPLGQEIIDNRNLFISKRAYFSFTGYAHSQLKRMTHLAFKGYMGEKRKALVAQFGYDTKNAGHLIRLLRMGIEFMTTQELHVFREDAQDIIAIKNGEWSLEKVQREADRLFRLADEAFVRTELPAKPKKEEAEELLMSIIKRKLGERQKIIL